VGDSEELTADVWQLIRLADEIVIYQVVLKPGEIFLSTPVDVALLLDYNPDAYEWRKVRDD
jgi:hypothetical protein